MINYIHNLLIKEGVYSSKFLDSMGDVTIGWNGKAYVQIDSTISELDQLIEAVSSYYQLRIEKELETYNPALQKKWTHLHTKIEQLSVSYKEQQAKLSLAFKIFLYVITYVQSFFVPSSFPVRFPFISAEIFKRNEIENKILCLTQEMKDPYSLFLLSSESTTSLSLTLSQSVQVVAERGRKTIVYMGLSEKQIEILNSYKGQKEITGWLKSETRITHIVFDQGSLSLETTPTDTPDLGKQGEALFLLLSLDGTEVGIQRSLWNYK